MKELPLYCPNCESPRIHFKRGDGNAYCEACGFFPIYPVERVKEEPAVAKLPIDKSPAEV